MAKVFKNLTPVGVAMDFTNRTPTKVELPKGIHLGRIQLNSDVVFTVGGAPATPSSTYGYSCFSNIEIENGTENIPIRIPDGLSPVLQDVMDLGRLPDASKPALVAGAIPVGAGQHIKNTVYLDRKVKNYGDAALFSNSDKSFNLVLTPDTLANVVGAAGGGGTLAITSWTVYVAVEEINQVDIPTPKNAPLPLRQVSDTYDLTVVGTEKRVALDRDRLLKNLFLIFTDAAGVNTDATVTRIKIVANGENTLENYTYDQLRSKCLDETSMDSLPAGIVWFKFEKALNLKAFTRFELWLDVAVAGKVIVASEALPTA